MPNSDPSGRPFDPLGRARPEGDFPAAIADPRRGGMGSPFGAWRLLAAVHGLLGSVWPIGIRNQVSDARMLEEAPHVP